MALAPKHLLSVILLLLVLVLGQGALLYRLLHDHQDWQRDHAALNQQWHQLDVQLSTVQAALAHPQQPPPTPEALPPVVTSVPIGGIVAYVANAVPEDWLLCDGRTLDRAVYPLLYAALHPPTAATTSAKPTFNLPDLRGRFIVGQQPTDPDFQRIRQVGGEKTVTLTLEHIPPHNHTYWRSQYSGYVYDRFAKGSDKDAKELELPSSTVGEGKPHNNLPPYLTLSWIIRAQ
jgi:microcystin-dependent protein